MADLDFPQGGTPGGLEEAGDGHTFLPDATKPDVTTPDARQDARPDSDGPAKGDATASAYAAEVLSDSPSAYWRLGERSGTAARDESGSFPGTYEQGVALGVTGAVSDDTAARLDGQAGSQVRIGDVFTFANNVPNTLEAWVKWDTSAATGYVFSKRYDSGGGGGGGGYGLSAGPGADGKVAWTYARGRDDQPSSVTYSAASNGTFVHIVVTYDGTNARMYLNGAEVASADFEQGTRGAGGTFMLGGSSSGESPFKGTLDELAVYERALPADRIRAHFLAARP